MPTHDSFPEREIRVIQSFSKYARSYDRYAQLQKSMAERLAALLYGVLTLLGPVPLDYEIHEGPGVPLHAHVNARHFPYSNIGGTLNLPSTLAASIRQARSQRGG